MTNDPIIVTGPPRSGTTLLAGLLNLHPEVGPKRPVMTRYESPGAFLREQGFGPMSVYQRELEAHDVWRQVFATMGGFRDLQKQVRIHHSFEADKEFVLHQLSQGLHKDERLLVKNPELLFALPAILKTFPGSAPVLVCLRDPVDLFASVVAYRMFSAPPIEGFRIESELGLDLFARRLEGMLDPLFAFTNSHIRTVLLEDWGEDPKAHLNGIEDLVGLSRRPEIPELVDRPPTLAAQRLGPRLFDLAHVRLQNAREMVDELMTRFQA